MRLYHEKKREEVSNHITKLFRINHSSVMISICGDLTEKNEKYLGDCGKMVGSVKIFNISRILLHYPYYTFVCSLSDSKCVWFNSIFNPCKCGKIPI